MVKDTATVIREFNELVNMEPAELKDWLTGQPSLSAGWPKEDGTGETIGHDSGRHIVDILSRNPTKDLEKYESKDVEHMRKVCKPLAFLYSLLLCYVHVNSADVELRFNCIAKVVSYCKRHLAQEESAKKNPNSKSAKSLKNWGHDPQNEIGDSE
ncbi:hypothetical protein DFH27DRAFT_528296 [Peziza echinospora]|nr:hypothetical protein DFH27DRAFT_528296 [Peziza echinospora]